MKSQSISPEDVKILMENIWLRHRAGMKQRSDNVYMIEFLSHSPKDLAQMYDEAKLDELDNEATQYCGLI